MICTAILLATGGLSSGLKFCMDHPLFLLHATFISIVAMLSQLCIYPMIQEYGALAFAMTMNIRQVVSILASYAIYSKPVTVAQILGLSLIFSALYYKALNSAHEADEKMLFEPDEKRPLLLGNAAASKGESFSEAA